MRILFSSYRFALLCFGLISVFLGGSLISPGAFLAAPAGAWADVKGKAAGPSPSIGLDPVPPREGLGNLSKASMSVSSTPGFCDEICSPTSPCDQECLLVTGQTTTCGALNYPCGAPWVHCNSLPQYQSDQDCDGLSEAFEEALARRFEPVYQHSAAEGFYPGYVGPEGPVCAGNCPPTFQLQDLRQIYYNVHDHGTYIQITYWRLYGEDRCPECFFDCNALFPVKCCHVWDSERIALAVKCTNKSDPASCQPLEIAYFRHELPPLIAPFGTYPLVTDINYPDRQHPVVYIQRGKHGSYPIGDADNPAGFGCNSDACAAYDDLPFGACREWYPGGVEICGGRNNFLGGDIYCDLRNVGEAGTRLIEGGNYHRNLQGWTNFACGGGRWGGGATSVCSQLEAGPTWDPELFGDPSCPNRPAEDEVCPPEGSVEWINPFVFMKDLETVGPTGVHSDDWYCGIIGFDTFGGDIEEEHGEREIIRVELVPGATTRRWIFEADFKTQKGLPEYSWDGKMLCLSREVASPNGEQSGKPFFFQDFSNLGDNIDVSTGINYNNYACGIVGFRSGPGDINEKGTGDPIKLYLRKEASNQTWHIRADFHTHSGDHENWSVKVLCASSDLVSDGPGLFFGKPVFLTSIGSFARRTGFFDSYTTAIPTDTYWCGVVGFGAYGGDIDEHHYRLLPIIRAYADGNGPTWRVLADFRSEDTHEDWSVNLLCMLRDDKSRPAGCSDGTREGFIYRQYHPEIAACRGGWTVAGLANRKGPACNAVSGNSSGNPSGQGCAPEDLCAPGWHICESSDDVFFSSAKSAGSSPGCATLPPADPLSFFATRQSGPGNALCGAGTNDLFGCGAGPAPNAGTCSPLEAFSSDLCSGLHPSWNCGADGTAEALNVVKAGSVGGGVLCCRDVSTFTIPRVTFNGAAYPPTWTVYGRTEIDAATPIRCPSGSCVRLDRTGPGANYFGIYLQGIPIIPGQTYRAQATLRYAHADPGSGRAWAAIGNWSPKTNNHTEASLLPGSAGTWQVIEFDWVASGPETTLDVAIFLPPEYQGGPVDIQSVQITEHCTLSGGPCGPNQCEIGGQCFNANASNPADYCEVCNPAECQTRWSRRPDGTYCGGVSPNVVYCAPALIKCGVVETPRCYACLPGEFECF